MGIYDGLLRVYRNLRLVHMNLRLVHMNLRLVHMNALCFSSNILTPQSLNSSSQYSDEYSMLIFVGTQAGPHRERAEFSPECLKDGVLM